MKRDLKCMAALERAMKEIGITECDITLLWKIMNDSTRNRMEGIYGMDEERWVSVSEHLQEDSEDENHLDLYQKDGAKWSFEIMDGRLHLMHGPF